MLSVCREGPNETTFVQSQVRSVKVETSFTKTRFPEIAG
jgi:hypothetical protein